MSGRHPLLDEALALAGAGRVAEGMVLLERAASAGDPQAIFWLGEVHWVGGARPQDHSKGRGLFKRASDAGHPDGQICYTNLLANGVAGPRDWPSALSRLAQEAGWNPRRAKANILVEQMSLTEEGDPQNVPAGEVLSHTPRVTLFRGAFTPAECAFLTDHPDSHFRPARVEEGGSGERVDSVRTCDEVTIHPLIEDPAVHAINRRLAALSGTRVDQGEPLQLLRYKVGQQFRPHVDAISGDNGRPFTMLLYLNDGYAGGETLFVRTGLEVKGRTGDALLFSNLADDGSADPLSAHAGMPVKEGIKFIASRWIRQRRVVP